MDACIPRRLRVIKFLFTNSAALDARQRGRRDGRTPAALASRERHWRTRRITGSLSRLSIATFQKQDEHLTDLQRSAALIHICPVLADFNMETILGDASKYGYVISNDDINQIRGIHDRILAGAPETRLEKGEEQVYYAGMSIAFATEELQHIQTERQRSAQAWMDSWMEPEAEQAWIDPWLEEEAEFKAKMKLEYMKDLHKFWTNFVTDCRAGRRSATAARRAARARLAGYAICVFAAEHTAQTVRVGDSALQLPVDSLPFTGTSRESQASPGTLWVHGLSGDG
ncbi:hypothetical protein DFH11DRAFT_1744895 [Phellopilus nigrolimitatus]|nr:hypothetical protein DFH11DRAFT_1744895 [Phellopilus nigrolimitatus]